MALSRIWSAFIIVAILVAVFKWISWKDTDIFNRMVVGKADDTYGYCTLGNETNAGITLDNFNRRLKPMGFLPRRSPDSCRYVFTNNLSSDSIRLLKSKNSALIAMTYGQAMKRIQKPIDGIVETCWGSVQIALKLIGLMALFMGFMSIAERAGGVNLLSRIIGPFFTKLFPEIPRSISPQLADSRQKATLHQGQIFALYNHSSGFFARIEGYWARQSNVGYSPDIPGDDIFQANAYIGYRFRRNYGDITVGFLNMTDQDYKLNPLNYYNELPRERTLVARVRLNF